MADTRKNLRTLPSFTAEPCPDLANASEPERRHWDAYQRIEDALRGARADHGHTAIRALLSDGRQVAEAYARAFVARKAAEESARSGGDVVARIIAAWRKAPQAMQDEIYARMTELRQRAA